MAVYTELDKHEVAEVVEDYGLVKLIAATGIPSGSVNTNYLLETARGKHLLRVDEVKGELEVKRELDLLLFLRKHGFPCPQPLADRKGRLLPRVRREVPVGLPVLRRPRPPARRASPRRSSRTSGGCSPTCTPSARATRRASRTASASSGSPTSTGRSAAGSRRTSSGSSAPSTTRSSTSRLPRIEAAEGHHPRRPVPRQRHREGREGRRRARLRGGMPRASSSSTSRPR